MIKKGVLNWKKILQRRKSRRMVKNHLSRLNAPKSWPIQRKGIKFVTKPSPGLHSLRTSIPLSLVLIKLLKVARTNKEVKKILNDGNILINGKTIRKDKSYSVGVMDLITIPLVNQTYRILYDRKGKFAVLPLDAKEKDLRAVKIVCKTIVKKNKMQLNYSNGINTFVDKDAYETGDTLLLAKDNSIKEHLKFEKGATIYLTGGRKVGRVCTLEDVKENNIVLKSEGELFETTKRHAFVVGELTMLH